MIYVRALHPGKFVNHALINEIHSIEKNFPLPDNRYGLITIDEGKFNIKWYTFLGNKGFNFTDLKEELNRNHVDGACLISDRIWNKDTPIACYIAEENTDQTNSFILLPGRIYIENQVEVRGIMDKIEFPFRDKKIERGGVENYDKNNEVFFNDFSMLATKHTKKLFSEGLFEFFLFEISNYTEKTVQNVYIGSNGYDMNVKKSKKFFTATYRQTSEITPEKKEVGGLGNKVILHDYALDRWEIFKQLDDSHKYYGIKFAERSQTKPCDLSFVVNEEDYQEQEEVGFHGARETNFDVREEKEDFVPPVRLSVEILKIGK